MAKFEFQGIDELIQQYEALYNDTEKMIGAAIYNGAAVVMKEVVSAIEGISTDNRFGTPEHPTSGPNEYQKEGLRQSVGISRMRNDSGFRNVKIGFDGYNGLTTETWPSGQPNAMVARAVESGTSWMRKQPFMRKAERAAKGPCEREMAQTIDREIQAKMKGGSTLGGGSKGSGSAGSSGSIGKAISGKSRSYKPSTRKTLVSKKPTSTLKKNTATYKKYKRNIDKLVNGKVGNSTGTTKKYGRKTVTKKRGRKR